MGLGDWVKALADPGGAFNGGKGYGDGGSGEINYINKIADPAGGVGKVMGWFGLGGGGPNQTEIAKQATAQSTANAQNLYEQALAQAAEAQGIYAPTVAGYGVTADQLDSAAGKYQTQAAQAQAFDTSAGMKSYDAALAQAAAAAAQRAEVTRMEQQAPAFVNSINTSVNAPVLGDAAQTGAVGVQRVGMDPLAQQLRNDQIQAAKNIADAPSAAMSQFRAGESQVMSDAMAATAAARGSERAGARRDAMLRIASGGAQQNLAAAAMAAQEEQAKRVASSSAMSNIRSQDVTAAQAEMQVQAQQANLQAQIDQAIATGNTAAVNELKQQQANLTLQARQAELSAGLSQQSTMSNLEQANLAARMRTAETNVNAANAAAQNYASAFNSAAQQQAQNQTAVSLANAAAQTQAAANNTQAYNQAWQQYGNLATQVSQSNAAARTQASEANAARAASLDTQNVQNKLTAGTTTAGNMQKAGEVNASNTLTAEQLQQQTKNAALNTGINAVNTQSENARTITDANKSQSSADTQKQGALIGGAGSIVAGMISDERLKDDIAPIGAKESNRDLLGGIMRAAESPSARRKKAEEEEYATRDADWLTHRAAMFERDQANRVEQNYLMSRAKFTDLSDERAKDDLAPVGRSYESAFRDYGGGDKEDAKRAASRLSPEEIDDWAAHLRPITYRYKPGVEDDGVEPHIGLGAREVEQSGPIGELVVSRRPDGYREIDYGAAALMLGKAAFDKANEALLAARRGR